MSYFDHFAHSSSTKFGNLLSIYLAKRIFIIISKFIKDKNPDILEIGPGHGNLAVNFIANDFRKYDIIEPNNELREENLNKGVRSAIADLVPQINKSNNSYDVIIASDVFEHLNDAKESELFIKEIYRVLKHNGLVCIISPDINDWKIDFWNCDFSHSNPTSVRRNAQLFLDYNIRIVYYHYFYSVFDGCIGYLISRLIKLINIFNLGEMANNRLYKLKLSFLRRYLIIGKKE